MSGAGNSQRTEWIIELMCGCVNGGWYGPWVPAFAGMTGWDAGMTEGGYRRGEGGRLPRVGGSFSWQRRCGFWLRVLLFREWRMYSKVSVLRASRW